MTKVKVTDVLTDPEIQRHTERILALQKEEGQTREELGRIIIAAKKALDKTSDKTAWQRWLKQHVHYSADTAQNYMRVARFAEKNRSASVFFTLDPSVLYRLAALPDEKVKAKNTIRESPSVARTPRGLRRGGMAVAMEGPAQTPRGKPRGAWRTDWNRLKEMPDSDIDFSDVPNLDKAFFSGAHVRMPKRKKAVSLRLDPDVLDWFKHKEERYQTKINAVLRAYVEAHQH